MNKIIVRNKTDMLQSLCERDKVWGMYIKIFSKINDKGVEDVPSYEDIVSAAPYLFMKKDYKKEDLSLLEWQLEIIFEREGFFFFESKEDCNLHFQNTVGEDGKTAGNPYCVPVFVNAITCGPDGQLVDCNY